MKIILVITFILVILMMCICFTCKSISKGGGQGQNSEIVKSRLKELETSDVKIITNKDYKVSFSDFENFFINLDNKPLIEKDIDFNTLFFIISQSYLINIRTKFIPEFDRLGFQRISEITDEKLIHPGTLSYDVITLNQPSAPWLYFLICTHRSISTKRSYSIFISIRGSKTRYDWLNNIMYNKGTEYNILTTRETRLWSIDHLKPRVTGSYLSYTNFVLYNFGRLIEIVKKFAVHNIILKEILVTGHSLGGSIALVLAPIISRILGGKTFIYTLGSPISLNEDAVDLIKTIFNIQDGIQDINTKTNRVVQIFNYQDKATWIRFPFVGLTSPKNHVGPYFDLGQQTKRIVNEYIYKYLRTIMKYTNWDITDIWNNTSISYLWHNCYQVANKFYYIT